MISQIRSRSAIIGSFDAIVFIFILFFLKAPAAQANYLQGLRKEQDVTIKKIAEVRIQVASNRVNLEKYKDATIPMEDARGDCECGTVCKDYLASLKTEAGANACVSVYKKNKDYTTGAPDACAEAVTACGQVKRLKRVAELTLRAEELAEEVQKLEEEKKERAIEIADTLKNCPNCALAESFKPRTPTAWEGAAGVLQALTPAIMGGFNVGMGAVAADASAKSYQGYLDQCRQLGVPCNAPAFGGGMGSFGGTWGGYGGWGGGALGNGAGGLGAFAYPSGFGGFPGSGGLGAYGGFPGSGGLGAYGGFPGNGGFGAYGGFPGSGGFGGYGGLPGGGMDPGFNRPWGNGGLTGGYWNPYSQGNAGANVGFMSPYGGFNLGLGGFGAGFNVGAGGGSPQVQILPGLYGGGGVNFGGGGNFGGMGNFGGTGGFGGGAQQSQSLMMAAQQAYSRYNELQGYRPARYF